MLGREYQSINTACVRGDVQTENMFDQKWLLSMCADWPCKDSRVLWADVIPCCLCDFNLPHAQSSYFRDPCLLTCGPVINWLCGIRLLF